eukprot:CAMPEP_0180829988 /NCGR_PEP_ID=MMETSP1038_2-20121128/75562_1 /TAXON_ID=632150 /ORGANISM="Azadinium spinosum, Strain 3D9" /LENGTH=488 /DNA_ID=CAMNT_0022873083 /DNA_START=87 /DNA_END=1550 /DNA_ORIENTATION=-
MTAVPMACRDVGCSSDALSDEVVQKIIDFAVDMLLDMLHVAVICRQFNAASCRVFNHLVEEKSPDAQWLLTERMASNFSYWSQLSVSDCVGRASPAGFEIPDDDTLIYHCCRCRRPILRFDDIVSTNYHGAWGPAFLVSNLYNTVVEHVAYTASFVTGGYTVSDVTCAGCRLQLAKKYIEASDPVNRFKVGKYLLEQTRVFVPKCCSGGVRDPHLGAVSVCFRCAAQHRRTAQATLLMTGGLQPGPSRRLLGVLLGERNFLAECTATSSNEAGGRSGTRPVFEAVPKSFLAASSAGSACSEIWGSDGSAPGTRELAGCAAWKLAQLCRCLKPRGGVEAALLASFADQLTTSLAAIGAPTCSSGASPQAGPGAPPRRGEGAAAVAEGARDEHDVLISRLMRWEIIAPAAMVVCHDFQTARGLVVALRSTWQPVFPSERSSAEVVINKLADRFQLDSTEVSLLWQELGFKTRTGFCSWYGFCRGFILRRG